MLLYTSTPLQFRRKQRYLQTAKALFKERFDILGKLPVFSLRLYEKINTAHVYKCVSTAYSQLAAQPDSLA